MNASARLRPTRHLLPLFVAGVSLALQGCAGLPGSQRDGVIGSSTDGTSAEELDLIAQNLVFTLAQLSELNPMNTTVQLSSPRTEFGREIVRRVHGVGYGVQTVPDDRGANYLRYRVQRTLSEQADETRYVVSIGDVSVERSYERVEDRMVPISEQRVRGAEATSMVELNDDLFQVDEDFALSQVSFFDEEAPQIIDMSTGLSEPSGEEESSVDAFGLRVRQNLYGRLESNYAQIFADYEDVDQHSVSFPNDSMLLGPEQKQVVIDYAARARPETDLVSVIGCSHGNTEIDNGNSVLAIGRANRIKEALVYAGVPAEMVLDEGCWADTYHAVFPKRGVVLTLKRRRG